MNDSNINKGGLLIPTIQASRDIMAERFRQQARHGYSIQHDDEHVNGELAEGAAAYAMAAVDVLMKIDPMLALGHWPRSFAANTFRPHQTDPKRNLVKAGAMIQAELERLYRLEVPTYDVQKRDPNTTVSVSPSDAFRDMFNHSKQPPPWHKRIGHAIRYIFNGETA